MPHTRLLDSAAQRGDDHQVIALLRELPDAARRTGRVFIAGLLNELGVPYREVELAGEYEILQFTARMNANGFVQIRSGAVEGYDGVFCKP